MSNPAVLSVGGTALPTPAYQTFTCVPEELSNADRNTLGNLIKKRIAIKYTIDAEWHGLTAAEKNLLYSATAGNSFTMTYLDVTSDTMRSGQFYRGASPQCTAYGKRTGNAFQYYDVVMSFVEL